MPTKAGRPAQAKPAYRGAEGGIRTRTSISSQPPEDCVSTNVTTSACPVAEAGFEPAAKGL